MAAEGSALFGHEGQHGIDQRRAGTNPLGPLMNAAFHLSAYTVQGYVSQGLRTTSAYGIWVEPKAGSLGGWNQSAVLGQTRDSVIQFCGKNASLCR